MRGRPRAMPPAAAGGGAGRGGGGLGDVELRTLLREVGGAAPAPTAAAGTRPAPTAAAGTRPAPTAAAGTRPAPAAAGMTPEHSAWRRWRGTLRKDGGWRGVPGLASAKEVPRIRAPFPPAESVTERFLRSGSGGPAVFEGLAAEWEAVKGPAWELSRLVDRVGADTSVVANNRAPARARDADEVCGRQVCRTTFGQYLGYLQGQEAASYSAGGDAAPLYLNGWSAFAQPGFGPSLSADIGGAGPVAEGGGFPGVFEDDSFRTMLELDVSLKVSHSAGGDPREWAGQSDRMLNKIFMGPEGCITRFHFDAHNAHGWLAQVRGRKLFVLVPPQDSLKMSPFHHGARPGFADAGEPSQSPVDPLDPDLGQFPEYRGAHVLVAVCRPGDVVLIPAGWWHYAVSLDGPCITVMRNFWNLGSGNVRSLVEMFVGGIKKVMGRRHPQAPPPASS